MATVSLAPARTPAGSARARLGERTRVWVLAARVPTLSAAVAPVLVGAGLAQAHGVLRPLPAVAALACAILIQIGTNLANDYYDFVRGADTAGRAGALRVTQAGLVEPRRVKLAMGAVFGAAVLLGLYLVSVGGWPILFIGVASVLSGIAYTGGPWPFGYHGLGEVFVFVFFGLVAVSGTFYVQALTFEPGTLVAGAGVGALAAAVLVVNNLRDIRTDGAAGKRTLAVKLGAQATQVEYLILLALAAAAPVTGVIVFDWSPWALLAPSALLLAAPAARTVLSYREACELNAALRATARTLAAYGTLLATGLAL